MVLVVVNAGETEEFSNAAINTVNAACAVYGMDILKVVVLDPGVGLKGATSGSGRIVGDARNLERLMWVLDKHRDEFDAVALASPVVVPLDVERAYFRAAGKLLNPWGGAEAMLTHAVSALFDLPAAQIPVYMVNAVAMGVIWGLLRMISGSVIVASVSHGIWNGGAYVFFGFGTKVGVLGIKETAIYGPEVGVVGLVLNIVFAAALWRWWKASGSSAA